jgi:hypothetical protein
MVYNTDEGPVPLRILMTPVVVAFVVVTWTCETCLLLTAGCLETLTICYVTPGGSCLHISIGAYLGMEKF